MRAASREAARALLSLQGLSVGDALGEQFFGALHRVQTRIEKREIPPGPWPYTDDTVMAVSVVEELLKMSEVRCGSLFDRFATRYREEPLRGYGSGAHELYQLVREGLGWGEAARNLFGGRGSYGNGAAMRVAPLGAFFADDLDQLVKQADASARVTHAHGEGRAGAIAVAAAAAMAWRIGQGEPRSSYWPAILELTPRGDTLKGLKEASSIPASAPALEVAGRVGSGQRVTAADTVPFCLWSAFWHLDDYAESFWCTDRYRGIFWGIRCSKILLASRWRISRKA